MCERSLATATDNLARGNWRDAAMFARTAVENGAKTALACFSAVPRTHEPAVVLRAALASPHFPATLIADGNALVPELAGLGMQEHIELSYGDEERGIDPWTLVDEARARHHVDVAQRTARFARACFTALFGPP